jgi:hypothetical protein
MYSMKLFFSMILGCLNVCVPSQTMLYLANPGGPASNTQEVSSSSALSSELRAMAAKGAEEDGTVHFFDDIYGHDQRLNALLAKGPPYP